MSARTVGELIGNSYTLMLEEFLEQYTSPILIGVGILDSRMLQQPDDRHSTLALTLNPMDETGQQTRHHLMGHLIPIGLADGSPWTRVSLGRSTENDVVIDDPAVSEYHCYVKARGKKLTLGDLGSTNGTKVNGVPLKPPQTHVLHDEDLLTLGRCSFQYFTPAALYDYLSLGLG